MKHFSVSRLFRHTNALERVTEPVFFFFLLQEVLISQYLQLLKGSRASEARALTMLLLRAIALWVLMKHNSESGKQGSWTSYQVLHVKYLETHFGPEGLY